MSDWRYRPFRCSYLDDYRFSLAFRPTVGQWLPSWRGVREGGRRRFVEIRGPDQLPTRPPLDNRRRRHLSSRKRIVRGSALDGLEQDAWLRRLYADEVDR